MGTYSGDGCKSFIKFKGKPTAPDFKKVTTTKPVGTKSFGINVRAGSAAANASVVTVPAFTSSGGSYICTNDVTFPAPAGASYTIKMKAGTKFKSTVNMQVRSPTRLLPSPHARPS